MRLAGDLDDDFVETPDVIWAGRLAAEPPCVFRSEFPGPMPDGFIGDDDPAFEQHLLDQTQAEGKRKYSQTACAMISGANR